MKVRIVLKQEVYILNEVEVPDCLEGDALKEKCEELSAEVEGLTHYAGNGGTYKLVGVSGRDTTVELNEVIDLLCVEDEEGNEIFKF